MDTIDVIVAGAGVVGLACARSLSLRGLEVLVVERHQSIGQETSSRNSGVIHSGIYYPKGTLKEKLCVRGRKLLYAYCEKKGINHRRCGKLIVAQESELDKLDALRQKGLENGVDDLQWLDRGAVKEKEPLVKCAGALFSPSTGIVDVHEYLLTLQGDVENAGSYMLFMTEVVAVTPRDDVITVTLRESSILTEIACRYFINSTGLHAVDMAACIAGYPISGRAPKFAKGNYFACRGLKPFQHLVYPMPSEAGLGVHATLDLDGTTRFGPDVEWVDVIDYRVDAHRGDAFYDAIRKYWPTLPDDALLPAYAGIRPKLVGPGSPAADFVIEGSEVHGLAGIVNLLGIESPGLTSSLAIAEEVTARLAGEA